MATDCAGVWSQCTSECEKAEQRVFTQTVSPRAGGLPCPPSKDCVPEECMPKLLQVTMSSSAGTPDTSPSPGGPFLQMRPWVPGVLSHLALADTCFNDDEVATQWAKHINLDSNLDSASLPTNCESLISALALQFDGAPEGVCAAVSDLSVICPITCKLCSPTGKDTTRPAVHTLWGRPPISPSRTGNAIPNVWAAISLLGLCMPTKQQHPINVGNIHMSVFGRAAGCIW